MTSTKETQQKHNTGQAGGHPFRALLAVLVLLALFFGAASHFWGEKMGSIGATVNTFLNTNTTTVSAEDDWNLILVNPWNKVPDSYDVTLKQLPNGLSIDERCYSDLLKMMQDCEKAGLSPKICSAYRTQEKQTQLFEDKVRRLKKQGYAEDAARKEAAKSVAVPGTSEHQLGLAVDVTDAYNQNLDSSQEKTKVQKWLMKNSWKYGFILRYPNGKSDITGIIYEPWHYRYVGKKAAKEITNQGITLEEYLNKTR